MFLEGSEGNSHNISVELLGFTYKILKSCIIVFVTLNFDFLNRDHHDYNTIHASPGFTTEPLHGAYEGVATHYIDLKY